MLWAFIIMFVGVAVGVVGKMLMHDEIVTLVGVLVSLVGMFLTVYPYLSAPRREKPETKLRSQPEVTLGARSPVVIATAPQKALPDRPTEYTPSVTERTTDLLKVPRSKS